MTYNYFIKEQIRFNMRYVGKMPRKKKKELTTYLRFALTEYGGGWRELDRVFIAPYVINPRYRVFDGFTNYLDDKPQPIFACNGNFNGHETTYLNKQI